MTSLRWLVLCGLVAVLVGISAGTYVLMHREATDETDRWVEGYSARVSFTDLRNPSKSYRGVVYSNVLSQPRAFRMEMEFADHKRIHIWRQDAGASAVLDPDAKTYWTPKMQGSARFVAGGGPAIESGVKRLVGGEKVNGRAAKHWEISNVEGIVEESWEDVRLHVTVKSVKPGVSIYELTDIKEGRQRDELFQVPQEYKRVAAE